MTPEEEHLVSACRRHDERACKQLYDTYASKMFALCLRYAGDRESAQDVLHDGFIKVFEKIGQLRSDGNLTAWVYGIMMRTALTRLRREAVRSTDSIDDILIAELPSTYDYDRYDVQVLLNAIQSLPESQRLVFNLYEVEGYSFEEIAQMVGLKMAGVRSNYYRARLRLAEELNEMVEE